MTDPYWIVEHPNPWDVQGITEDEWCSRNCHPEPTCADYGHPPYAECDGRASCYCGEPRAAHDEKPPRPRTHIDGDDTWDRWPA